MLQSLIATRDLKPLDPTSDFHNDGYCNELQDKHGCENHKRIINMQL